MAFGGYSQISMRSFGEMIVGQYNNNGLALENIPDVAKDIMWLIEDRFETPLDQDDKRRFVSVISEQMAYYGYVVGLKHIAESFSAICS